MPSDAKKPMVVWVRTEDVEDLRRGEGEQIVEVPVRDLDVYSGDRPFLLLPIEDGALRVGDHLFRQRAGITADVAEYRTDDDPEGEWKLASSLDLWDLLMDAVEGVEP